MNDKNKIQPEVLKQARRHALDMLEACEEAQDGRISAEEFEKRMTKVGLRGRVGKVG